MTTEQNLREVVDETLRAYGQVAYDIAPPEQQAPPPQSASLGIDPALFHRLDALKAKIRADKSATKAEEQEAGELEEQLVEQFAMAGVGEIMLGGRKGSLQPQLWAAKLDDSVTPEQIVAALRASDLEWLITPESYHSGTLSSYVRELDEAGEELPPALAEVIQPVLRTKIGFSRGTASQRRAAARHSRTPAAGPESGESPA